VKFVVYSRLQILRLDLQESHAVISIREPGSDMPAIPRNELCRGILSLSFHDLHRPERPDVILFTAEHAREIFDFFTAVRPELETLVIHCEAGISRSAAVAAALSRATIGADSFFFEHYAPNPLVYSTLLAVWRELSPP